MIKPLFTLLLVLALVFLASRMTAQAAPEGRRQASETTAQRAVSP